MATSMAKSFGPHPCINCSGSVPVRALHNGHMVGAREYRELGMQEQAQHLYGKLRAHNIRIPSSPLWAP